MSLRSHNLDSIGSLGQPAAQPGGFQMKANTALCLIQLFYPGQSWDSHVYPRLWFCPIGAPLLCSAKWVEELSHVFLGCLLP